MMLESMKLNCASIVLRNLILFLPFLGMEVCTADELPTCASTAETHEMLNATLWEQTSAEYYGVTQQIYSNAKNKLEQALGNPSWTAELSQTKNYEALPPAIMLDIDETILNNTCYEARIVKDYKQYSPETFGAWCMNQKAVAVPGVVEFLKYAHAKNVTIFYFSGRTEDLKSATKSTLKKLDLPLNDKFETILLNEGKTTAQRRMKIAERFRILLLIGDNMDDFVDGSKNLPEQRLEIAAIHKKYWGTKWIILPNPIYGHWEAAIYGFDYAMPRAEILRKKLDLLNSCH